MTEVKPGAWLTSKVYKYVHTTSENPEEESNFNEISKAKGFSTGVLFKIIARYGILSLNVLHCHQACLIRNISFR